MNEPETLRQLANALMGGTASAKDAERLSSLLRDNPRLRDEYLDYLDTHALLCWHFRDLAAPRPSNSSVETTPVPLRRTGAAIWFPWLVAGLAVALAIVSFLRPVEPPTAAPRESGDGQARHADPSIVALLVDEAGAEFAPAGGPQGVRFGLGNYELRRGMAHLRFVHGADLVLVAPARLEVEDARRIRLVEGRIQIGRAHV